MESTRKTSSTYFFYKSVLRKVSFNAVLFKKELHKALVALPEREGVRLYRWALTYTRSQPELSANLLHTF
ncbi:MAG: hypothetical protein VWZ97_03135 [Flavobacteriaceae bacterium]